MPLYSLNFENLRMKFYSFSLLLTLIILRTEVCSGQMIEGHVFDKKSAQPLEFVTIGVIGTNFGTVSDETGRFSLNLSKLSPNDKVRISFIGYKPVVFTISDLTPGISIQLENAPTELPEVVVRHRAKPFYLGETTTSKKTVTGWGGFGVGSGGERGILIDSEKFPLYPSEVSFNIARCAYDSVLLRLHIRQIEDGVPGKELLTENIYHLFRKGSAGARVDLSKMNLQIASPCVVSLEWVKTFGNCSGEHCNLQFSLRRGRGLMYTKEASEGTWSKFENAQPSIALTCFE